tara:strand:- start:18323 stop:19255 length:933 start_codon:yes stop_codon:yes gene_type:complete
MTPAIIASIENPESLRLLKKYIEPIIGIEDGARIRTSTQMFSKDSYVTINAWTIVDNKYCAVVSSDNIDKEIIPISKISKYKSIEQRHVNKGVSYEQKIALNLNNAGLMQGQGAGCLDGWDCSVQCANGTILGMEIKYTSHCILGQGVLHCKSDGWQISDKFKARSPIFASSVERATIDGEPLLEYVKANVSKPYKNEIKRGVSIWSDDMDFSPILGYLKDKNVDLLHIGKKGTYRVQETLPELPLPSGTCRIRVRGKHKNSLTALCVISNIIPSHSDWNMLSLEELENIKQRYLGYAGLRTGNDKGGCI